MRAYVVRSLFLKEVRRVAAHRGTVGMLLLFLVAAVLFSVLGPRAFDGALGSAGAPTCVIDTWNEGPWVSHLRRNVPPGLRSRIQFRSVAGHPGLIRYSPGAVGIQLRPGADDDSYKVWTWHAPGAAESAAWCEGWLWRESRRHFLEAARIDERTRALLEREISAIDPRDDAWALREAHARFRERLDAGSVPRLDVERSPFRVETRPRDAIAMGFTLLALFFVGIFLLPSMTCEERERGVLAAIALSPASWAEIVAAKLGFYFVLALALAVALGGISSPPALGRPFFWLSVAVVALGAVSIGFSIASLAKTQRGASLGALSYLFATGVLMVTGRGSVIEPVTWVLFERHGPELLLSAFSGAVQRAQWFQLGLAAGLAGTWVLAASVCYRRFGWR